MGKSLHETPLTTPNARKNLKAGLYWRGLDPEVHLGYRKNKRAGSWLVRWRAGKGYRQSPLGVADDILKEGALSFAKAESAARKHVEQVRLDEKAAANGPPITVQLAIEEYIAIRDTRMAARAGKLVRSDASHRLTRHVLGANAFGRREATNPASLAEIHLHKLSETDLRNWRQALPSNLKSTTVRRLTNDLKAALNSCAEFNRERLPPTLPTTIKLGLRLDTSEAGEHEVAREGQILSDNQVSELISAAREVDDARNLGGDLFRLVLVLAATGARFSQIARLSVADFQIDKSRLLVPRSLKGKGNRSGSIAVPIGQDVVEELVLVAKDRAAGEPLLERWHFKRAGRLKWEKSHRGAWGFAYDLTPHWASIRERAEMPNVIPYALRHSSIVRGIRANLPIRLVAALHDTSVEMIERHYSRWIVDGLDDLAASAVVKLVRGQSE